jgi:hypothetical protein
MSTQNAALMKADLALSDLSSFGLMQPEQASSFIRKLIKSPTILRMARVVEMTASTRKINKISFGSRILQPGTSGTALSSGQRSKPTTEGLSLTTKEVIAEVRLPYDVLEDSIERATAANNEVANSGPGGLRDTLITLIAERAALDLEEMGLLGDTTNTSYSGTTLALVDGFLKRAYTGGNIVDNNGQTVDKTLFKAGMKTIPDQYLRNRAAMFHFVSTNNETEYRDTLANRGTAMGDANIQGNNEVYAYGVPVRAVPLMPETDGLFSHPLNLVMGIQRQVSMEFDKDITARVYIIVLTARVDFQVEEALATVRYSNIGS